MNDVEMDAFYRASRKKWHRPRLYRVEIATDVRRPLRLGLNRYPHHVLGAFLNVGRWSYCVKWAGL